MTRLAQGLLVLSLSTTGFLAERLVDPHSEHEHDYYLDGPRSGSEVFYVSSNWTDENGVKHDDRVGDALIVTSLVSGFGAIALYAKQDETRRQPTQ